MNWGFRVCILLSTVIANVSISYAFNVGGSTTCRSSSRTSNQLQYERKHSVVIFNSFNGESTNNGVAVLSPPTITGDEKEKGDVGDSLANGSIQFESEENIDAFGTIASLAVTTLYQR